MAKKIARIAAIALLPIVAYNAWDVVQFVADYGVGEGTLGWFTSSAIALAATVTALVR
jgi:hypothetical protein